MKLLECIVLIICILAVLNLFFQAIYCRFEKTMEQRMGVKQKQISESKKSMEKKEVNKKFTVKHMLGKFYWWSYHYLYGLMRYSIIMTGKIPSFRVRKFLYRYVFCMDITKKTIIYGGCEFRTPWNIHMGNCVVSVGCIFDGRNGIFVSDNVVFGSGVHIWTEEHSINDELFRVLDENRQPVVIKDRAWICSDSTLLPGVVVGKGAVVASRACVTKNCNEYTVYGGVPAKKIGERNKNVSYELNGKPHWHFY